MHICEHIFVRESLRIQVYLCEAQLGCAGNGNCDYCKQRWEHVGQNFELIENIYDLVPTNTQPVLGTYPTTTVTRT